MDNFSSDLLCSVQITCKMIILFHLKSDTMSKFSTAALKSVCGAITGLKCFAKPLSCGLMKHIMVKGVHYIFIGPLDLPYITLCLSDALSQNVMDAKA